MILNCNDARKILNEYLKDPVQGKVNRLLERIQQSALKGKGGLELNEPEDINLLDQAVYDKLIELGFYISLRRKSEYLNEILNKYEEYQVIMWTPWIGDILILEPKIEK